MSTVYSLLDEARVPSPLRTAFIKWQCRVRQNAMRDNQGRPDDGIMPELFLRNDEEPLGQIITILNKSSSYSVTPELQHMLAKTNDPAQRRDQAIRFFSATYYQKAAEFTDVLTATFPADSPGAAKIIEAGSVRLVFRAYAQVFDLHCRVLELNSGIPLYEATLAHNKLFNPTLKPDVMILGFKPNWQNSTSEHEHQ